ncbi:MAG: chorismate synthase [Bacteroidales bacterium]
MNSFGRMYRVSLFGESHGPAIGVVIDGVPPGIPVSLDDLGADLSRRRSGRKGTTPRKEEDIPEILSGVYNGFATGAPLTIITRNRDTDSSAYKAFGDMPRPGHADFTASVKYRGFTDPRGGGHFSGRITWGLVVAGVIAKKIIAPVSVRAVLKEAGGSLNIEEAVENAVKTGDSIGGLIECTINSIPAGYGEPFFDSIESVISHAVFAVPAVKGIEFGSGFKAASMKGSEHNDAFADETGRTFSNNAGGINGGITNGNDIVFRVAVKPTSSIGKPQTTYNFAKKKLDELTVEGRHDSCIALRIPVVIEAAASIALADIILRGK